MLVCLLLFHRSLKLSSLFYSFFFLLFSYNDFHLSSSSQISSSVSSNLLLIPYSIFLILVIVFFSSVWIFLIFSNSLLKFSLCLSILISSTFEHLYDHYLELFIE